MNTLVALALSTLSMGMLQTHHAPTPPPTLAVADTVPRGSPRRSADGRLAVRALKAGGVIQVDGFLGEPEWAEAEAVTDFVQMEPHQGDPATEVTVVRVVFDDDYLYVAAHCYDSRPDGLVVNDLKQDFNPDNQDTFQLILDTFADRRNGYVFIVNPEGAKADWQVANEGREVNTSWEAPWSAAARRVDDGWTAEIAIPFRALRFERKDDPVWGINFARSIRRKNEEAVWSPIHRSYTLARLSVAGNLEGLTGSGGGRDLRVKPYVAGSTVRETGGSAFQRNADVGLDVKYGLTGGLTLDLTANPDFAQAETDEQQVNLTQFSQFFPEKRDFFLENSGLFYVGDAARRGSRTIEPRADTDLLLFFSRRIGLTRTGRPVPIDGGLRLTGEAGGFLVGALTMRTRAFDDVPANDYSVVRLRHDVPGGGDVGAVFMSRQAVRESDDYNRVYGMDSNFRFFGDLDWNSYLIRTETPGLSGGEYAYRTSLNRDGTFFHVKAGLMSLGENFNDELGSYYRVGVRKWFLDTGLRPRPSGLQRKGLREIHPHAVWDYFEDQQGRIVAKKLHNGNTFFLSNGGSIQIAANLMSERISTPFRISRGVEPIPIGSYDWTTWQLTVRSDPSRVVSADVDLTGGGLWSGSQRTVRTTVLFQPSYRFRSSVGLSRTAADLDLPDAEFVKSLWTLRASYSFGAATFVDALTQYDPEQRLLNANVRFNLIHHPLSDLFIVLNEQRFMTDAGTVPGRSVVVKVTQMVAF